MSNIFAGLSNENIIGGISLDAGVNGRPTVDGGKRRVAGVQVRATGHLLVAVTRSRLPGQRGGDGGLGGRKNITGFSVSSQHRMRRYLREALPEYVNMLTLTYPVGYGRDGRTAKRDLSAMLKRMRRHVNLMGIDVPRYSVFWFLEFTGAGTIHYHLFTTHFFNYKWLRDEWYEVVGSEDERHRAAGTRIESFRGGKHGMSAYAAKYAAKQGQKEVPEGMEWVGRFWGVSGWRATMSADTWVEPADMQSGQIRRLANELETVVRQGVEAGKIKRLSTVEGCSAYYIKSLALKARIVWLIERIEQATTTIRPWGEPYFEPDLDDGR